MLAMVALGCGRSSAPPKPPPVEAAPIACRVVGTVARPWVLFGNAGQVVARTRGAPVGVTVVPTTGPRLRAVFASPPHGPALHVEATLEAHELPLAVGARATVVPDLVSLAPGTRVAVVATAGEIVRVRALSRYFAGIEADVSCDALVLSPAPKPTELPSGAAAHLAGPTLHLSSTPGGAPFALTSPWPEGVTLTVLGASGDRRHVAFEAGVTFDGWAPAAELVDGAGADCDDCEGSIFDVDDVCGGRPSTDDGCPLEEAPVKVGVASPVKALPDEDAETLGWVDVGAEVFALETRGAWTRVSAKDAGLADPSVAWPPTTLEGFWIRTGAL